MDSEPEVSVVTTTFRPGGLDVTLAGMRDQTFRDFELVICDRRYEKRHQEVMALADEYGVRAIHVPEHRRNGKWTTFCSAWNTGFAVARGKYVIILQDYAYCPPGWIAAHLAHLRTDLRQYVAGPYAYTEMPRLRTKIPFDFSQQMDRGGDCSDEDAVLRGEVLPEMLAFEEGPFQASWCQALKRFEAPHQDVRRGIRPEPGTIEDCWIHVKNESVARETLWELGGLDERLERGKGPMDIDLGLRLERAGVQIFWDPTMPEQVVPNPRWICRTMPWGAMSRRVSEGSYARWSYEDGLAYNERRKREIGAAPDIVSKIAAAHAKNNYRIEQLAERLEPWRDPRNHPVTSDDIDDDAYWGRQMWPESP
jgi:glycosyltransferase involved in cell wall biosynthesis